MPPKPCYSNAERLKAQGNEFHQKGQYQAAHRKYTEAIKEDPTNAIYYANRAASSLAMNEYLDAAGDANKAKDLDPNYAKAWSRLGSATFASSFRALAAYDASVNAWKTALECLPPKEQSNESQKTLRAQFAAGLAKARKAQNTPIDQDRMIPLANDKNMPWTKAAELEADYVAKQKHSSAFVILVAYREFKEGVDAMMKVKKTYENGHTKWFGKAGALADISNGVLRDPRVFHLNGSDWIDKFNEQVSFEAQLYNAWVQGGAKTIKQEAPQRLKKEGWDSVRFALSITIRAWLMLGLLANSTGIYSTAMEYYSRIIDVLDWGAHTWRDVPLEDRGVIFEKTFIRAAKRLKLATMHTCITTKETGVVVTRDELVEFARNIIAETDANPPPLPNDLDFADLASFWMYPKGEALSILGWHHMQLGHEAKNAEDAQNAYSQSSIFYINASLSYPRDEEATLTFYKVAVEAFWYMPEGYNLKRMLGLLHQIGLYYADVMKIWEHSAAAKGREKQLLHALEVAARCQDAMEAGEITLEDVVRPKEWEPLCKWGGKGVIYV
ncbi:hypothetical protein HYPSUDRAFT_163391 [Hypholoma sublateritium FD-334 SS-4]|uniref:TPR-like protein n=1 Tax=Hypholoma sublateritium (strain FD-334 SS-4) TaxID=945553 RepID=A0A0D2L7Q7_HYPSF|nr:hypothetical protein HYPSUDRAFT_163391 [Hypholoma sublateritium FD-334 SS-4]